MDIISGFLVVLSRLLLRHKASFGWVRAAAILCLASSIDASALPNLKPHMPPGWSDKIVVSTAPGTTTDSAPLTTVDPLYIDWAVINDGNQPVLGGCYVTLYVDNVWVDYWFVSVNAGQYVFRTDYFLGYLSAGAHTVTIYADSSGFVLEQNEADNVYTKNITIVAPSLPNLTPYQPSGWSDKIVISKTTGTTVDDGPLTNSDTLYLDWAIINNGSASVTAAFSATLYIDGFFHVFWNNPPPVLTDTWQLITDYAIGPLPSGTHTITIVADSGGNVFEANELDNVYTKTINISEFPDIRIGPTDLTFDAARSNPTIFVEIDWMETGTHSHKPSQAVLNKIVETFAAEGFRIHLELSEAIPHQNLIDVSVPLSAAPAIQAIRDTYFDHIGDNRYYYSIWGHSYSFNGEAKGSSGIADLPGSVSLVTLGTFANQVGTFENQVGTFIHEFGHNLGQKHGGTDHDNFKPCYLSVMNYLYQLEGIGPQLVALGFADSTDGINDFAYSHGALPPLNESALDENLGLGLGQAVNWNCDGDATDVNVIKDIQVASWCGSTGPSSMLADFDNWSNLVANILPAPTAALNGPDLDWDPCISSAKYAELKASIAEMRKANSEWVEMLEPPALRGNGSVGSTSSFAPIKAATFTIFNDGGADLLVSSIGLDAPAPWITWWPAAPFSVPPNVSRKVVVYVHYGVAPAAPTTRRLIVHSNDPDESPYAGAVFVNSVGGKGELLSLHDLCETNGVVQFAVAGPIGTNVVVQASTNLLDWTGFSTNTILLHGVAPVLDHTGGTDPKRYYRAKLP